MANQGSWGDYTLMQFKLKQGAPIKFEFLGSSGASQLAGDLLCHCRSVELT